MMVNTKRLTRRLGKYLMCLPAPFSKKREEPAVRVVRLSESMLDAITGPVDIGEAITTVLPVETTVTDCELDVYLTTDEQLLDGSNSSIDDTVYDSTYIDFKESFMELPADYPTVISGSFLDEVLEATKASHATSILEEFWNEIYSKPLVY